MPLYRCPSMALSLLSHRVQRTVIAWTLASSANAWQNQDPKKETNANDPHCSVQQPKRRHVQRPHHWNITTATSRNRDIAATLTNFINTKTQVSQHYTHFFLPASLSLSSLSLALIGASIRQKSHALDPTTTPSTMATATADTCPKHFFSIRKLEYA
mmetsp:Transcript_11551/g.31905  ORF Transcript_11551/g.31905 Transcript_11551/m.31905 type:complete len:157 (-) Transcript_11551:29-499(-)